MKIKEVEIKNGAVFITDAHYKKGDKNFLDLLTSFIKNPPPQIFFLGDIFHLLLPFEFLYEYNKEAIELINKLAEKTKIYYIYGNHDFCIDEFFPEVIFADAFIDKKNSVYLSHGDLDSENIFYKIYTKAIRNKFVLKFLNYFTFNFANNWLFRKILNKPVKCNYYISNLHFNKNFDYILIGHFHNLKKINNILILASFFCYKNYYIIQIEKKINFKEINYGR
jgi:UDP-2,3-diacylglucosamine hydrolase